MSKTITIEIPDFQPLVNATRAMEVNNKELCSKIKTCSVAAGASIPDQIGQYVYEMLLPALNDGAELGNLYDRVRYLLHQGKHMLCIGFGEACVNLLVDKNEYVWCSVFNANASIDWNPTRIATVCNVWPKAKEILFQVVNHVYESRQASINRSLKEEQANFNTIMNFKL